MSPKLFRCGLILGLCLVARGTVMAQGASNRPEPVKPSGPAAKKADDLIAGYTARIEKEIEQGRKEVERLRTELHELIDLRYAMTEAIIELRGDLATKGTYSNDPVVTSPAAVKSASAPQASLLHHRDFVHGLGSALPVDPSVQQREQLRRLTPRSDLKRMIERLRAEVEETRAEVDQSAIKLLQLNSGVPTTFQGMGGMGGQNGQWFGSMGRMQGGMM
jgi:hypothetical protein